MADRAIGGSHVRAGQHRAGEVGDDNAVGPEIASLVEPELVIEAQNEAVLVDCRAHPMDRASRLVRRHQMLVTVFDPLDGAPEPQRRRAGQNVFRIKLATNAESAADMPFVEVNPVERQPEHRRERLAIVMRHLGSAVQPKDAADRFRYGDRAACFERHAAVPADGQLQRYHRMRSGKGSVEIAVGFGDHCGLGTASRREFARRRGRIQARRQRLDFRHDKLRDILGDVGVSGEYCRHRLADVAHMSIRQDRLAIRVQPRNWRHAKADRGDFGDVFRGPDGNRAGVRQRLCDPKASEAAERDRRAYYAHIKRVRWRDIGRELAAAGEQRAVFQALDRSADQAHLRISAAAASTDLRMF